MGMWELPDGFTWLYTLDRGTKRWHVVRKSDKRRWTYESWKELQEVRSEREKEKINGIVRVLEKLERVHWQHRNVLVEMNKDLEDPGLKKVSKMEGKIQQVKESFGTREKKESLHPRPAQSGGEDCSSRRRHQGRRRSNQAVAGGRCQPERGRL